MPDSLQQIVLTAVNHEKYFENVLTIMKKIAKNESIIYVSTNKSYDQLISLFKSAKIDTRNFFFIDCISRTMEEKREEGLKNVLHVESPEHLTSISFAITESIKHLPNEKIVVLDSLSTMLIYNGENAIGMFSNFIINKMRAAGVGIILLVLETDLNKEVVKKIETFVDKVEKY